MVTENKSHGVLIIENNRDRRSYFAAALKGTGKYSVKVAANAQDIFDVINTAAEGEIKFIIVNSNLTDDNFCTILQKLKSHKSTFLSNVILISDDIDESTKFLLEELSIQIIFPQSVEAVHVIQYVEKLKTEYEKNILHNNTLRDLNIAIKNGQIEEVEKLLQNENFKLYLMSSDTHISLYGETLVLKKEYEECINFLGTYVKNADTSAKQSATISILNCYAKALCLLNKHDEALMIYSQMEAKSPKNLGHKLNVCQVHLANGRWQSALDILEHVLKEDPQNDEALLKSAEASVALGKPTEAKLFMDKIAGKANLNALVSFYNNRGVAFAHMNELEKALEFYRNALFFCDKESSKVLFNIGICLIKNNQKEEALKILTELQKSDDFQDLYENKNIFQQILKEAKE